MTGVLQSAHPDVATGGDPSGDRSPARAGLAGDGTSSDRSERMPARPRLLARAKRSVMLGVAALALATVSASWVVSVLVLAWSGHGATRDTAVALAAAHLGVLIAVMSIAGVFARRSTRFIEGIFNQEDRLVRTVAHEIRRPLGQLVVTLDDGQDGLVSPQDAIREARIEAERVADFVGDLTEAAKVMSGAKARDTDPVRLDQLTDTVGATIEVGDSTISVDAVPIETTGSRRLLRLALVNLVRNASRHGYASGPGVIELVVDRSGVTVKDRGPGIEPDRLRRITRTRSTALPRSDLGLGLMTAEWAAELHGGRLVLDNRPGGGFEARLELPVREPDKSDDASSGESSP